MAMLKQLEGKSLDINAGGETYKLNSMVLSSYDMSAKTPIGNGPFSFVLRVNQSEKKTELTTINPVTGEYWGYNFRVGALDTIDYVHRDRPPVNIKYNSFANTCNMEISAKGMPTQEITLKILEEKIVDTPQGKIKVVYLGPNADPEGGRIGYALVDNVSKNAVPSLKDQEVHAGVLYAKGPISAELTGAFRKRIEELVGSDFDKLKVANDFTWRLTIGMDLSEQLKLQIQNAVEEQQISFSGNVKKTGTGYSLDYKKSNAKGEWSNFITEETKFEIRQGLLKNKTGEAGIVLGYTQHDDAIVVKDMSEIKSLNKFFKPSLYLSLNPGKAANLYAELGSMQNGSLNGFRGSLGLEYKGIKLNIINEALGEYNKNSFAVNYTYNF